MSVTRGEAVRNLVRDFSPSDLAVRYQIGIETQVNVDKGDGQQVVGDDGRPTPMFKRDGDTWYSFRIASLDHANKEQTYNLLTHFEAVGISGWDPVRGVSVGVGFDFDSIVGHQAGLSQDRLDQLLTALMKIEYIEVRKSTGGGGYHIWVWFDPANLPTILDRMEHKALARAVLQMMSRDCGHDFEADVDCYGAILWICAKRATPENGGLSLVRPAQRPLTDYPADWREHLSVVVGKRKRTKLHADLSDAEANEIDEAHQDRPRVALDEAHRLLIQQHAEVGYHCSWNQDLGCLNGHTAAIKAIQGKYGLKGVFQTISDGTDPNVPNCFMFPGLEGRWRVFRFNKDAAEAPTWEKSPNGWTTCTINEPTTLAKAALAYGGVKSPQTTVDAYLFRDAEAVKKTIEAMSGKVEIPDFLHTRTLSIRKLDDAVVVSAVHADGDDSHVDEAWKLGWSLDRKKWAIAVKVEMLQFSSDPSPWTDGLVRHVAQKGKQISLFANTSLGWQQQQTDRVRDFLRHHGVDPPFVPFTLGWCAAHPWELVAVPFSDEYPGRRRWNRDGSKLLFVPAAQPGPTPHWDMILEHIGRGLDDAVAADAWCESHGIVTGVDYLQRWTAILLRTPKRRLPLLFMFSHPEQNTGKSVFHEGLCQLFDENGFTFADKALTLTSGFNAELWGTALCVVEETNLAKSDLAYNRLKAWVTGPSLQICPKGKDSFADENYSHWVMTANNPENLPIESADTRVVMWEVTPFEGKEIPKDKLLAQLRKEAPQFLHNAFALDISESAGRHTLPVLMTAEKATRIAQVESVSKYGGLPEPVRKLCEAIIAMPKPFSGPATALAEALGDWNGAADSKSLRSRVTTIGRHMKRLSPVLDKQGIKLVIEEGRTSNYAISA